MFDEEFAPQWKAIKDQIFEDSICHDYGREVFDKIWAEACERGHSNGMCEIVTEFDILDGFVSDLMKVVKK